MIEALPAAEEVLIQESEIPEVHRSEPVQESVISPPHSPIKATDDVEEQETSPEIDIHNLNIPTVLYLEALTTK